MAVIGCGTWLYMAHAFARLREAAGLGATDAWPGCEHHVDRGTTRQWHPPFGTTSEIIDVLETCKGRVLARRGRCSTLTRRASAPAVTWTRSRSWAGMDERPG